MEYTAFVALVLYGEEGSVLFGALTEGVHQNRPAGNAGFFSGEGDQMAFCLACRVWGRIYCYMVFDCFGKLQQELLIAAAMEYAVVPDTFFMNACGVKDTGLESS